MTQRDPVRPRRLQAKPLDRRSLATGGARGALDRVPAERSALDRSVLDQRLRHLSEIGHVLARPEPADRALPAVASIVERAVPLRALFLVTGEAPHRRALAWSGRGTAARDLRVARSHALRWSSYLGGAAAWSARDLWDAGPERPRLQRAALRLRDLASTALTMPIGAAGGDVLGALLGAGAPDLGEEELVFLHQVATLFASALDRERQRDREHALGQHASASGESAAREAGGEPAREGVVAIDGRGRVNFVSPAARRLLGWRGEPLVGRHVSEILSFRAADGAALAADQSPVARALDRGEEWDGGDVKLAIPGGDPSAVRFSVTPLRAVDGPARGPAPRGGLAAIAGALILLREAPDAPRSERTDRLLALSAATLATSLDPDETLEAVTRLPVPVLADLCCIDRIADDGAVERRPPVVSHDLERGSSWAIVRRDAPPDWESPQSQVLRRGETLFCSDVRGTVVAGTCDVAGAPCIDLPITSMVVVPLKARGRMLGAITFAMTDTRRRFTSSDLRDLEEVAARAASAIDNAALFKREQMASRSREDILAVVSHDLRNPLGVVIGGAALLLEMPLHEDRRRRLIQAIQRAAQRMRRLIGDLLDASCLDGGRLSMEIARQPADVLVRDAVEMVSHPAPTGRRLAFVCDADPVVGAAVVCDRDRILQVFSNLIGNAIDFTPDGGTIRVGARREGDDVVFFVTDDGPGIAPEHLPHVFERFWQMRRGPGPRKGLGLGLPIAQGIVETHGGRIWVESVAGRGSTFYFSLHAVLAPVRPT